MNHVKRATIGAAALISALTLGGWPAAAQDASFGCQVLLCAASQNPSWQGVAYCVPPMMKLISIRKVHPGYWPICAEAGTGKPGRQAYEDCPQGWSETTLQSVSGGNGVGRDRAGCQRQVVVECPRFHVGGRDSGGDVSLISRRVADGRLQCMQTQTMARALRKDPYYFDIRNKETGTASRHWFNLNH